MEKAVKRGLFARSTGRAVTPPEGLMDLIEAQLAQRCLARLGLARGRGEAETGFGAVRAAIKSQEPGWLLEASDASADGRGKVLGLAAAVWGETQVAGCFTAAELGDALGRASCAHVFLAKGDAAAGLTRELRRLQGFRDLVPKAWEDEEWLKRGATSLG